MRVAVGCLILAVCAASCGRTSSPGSFQVEPSASPAASYNPVRLAINAIQGPPSALVGQPVSLTANVVLPDGCTYYDRLDVAVDEATATVLLTARGLEAQGVYCTQNTTLALVYKPVTTSFTPAHSGVYTVRTAQGDAVTTVTVR
jgi:hypothetical protein